MNVLKIVIVSLIFIELFAVDLYIPEGYQKSIPIKEVNIKKYLNVKEINFNNALGLVSYNEIPLIFEKNLTVITPLGEVKEYILTHKKSLADIKTVINLDFGSRILLDSVNSKYKAVKGNLNEFLNSKSDAIVYSKVFDKEGIFDFPLKLYGIDFNRYFIVSSKNFIKKNRKLIKKLNEKFENKLNFHKRFVYKTFLLSGLYLNKKVDFNKLLFENYRLTQEQNENSLIIDITPNWQPFDIYKDGHLYGIGVDFWRLIAKKAKLKYKFNLVNYWSDVLKEIKEKKADLTINTSETKDRKKYAIFSKPYASFPLAIICRNDENFNSIKNISSLAVGKNFTAEKLMKEYYPNLNYIETKTTLDALKLVKIKKVQCAVDILPSIIWNINQNHLINMQIAFKTPFKFNVQIMIRRDRPDLLNKINKAIDSISPKEREKIINTYISTILVDNSSFNWKSIGVLILGILVIIIVLIIRIRYLSTTAKYDVLTELLNRRGVFKMLESKKGGALLYLDIDHFKKINDTYGHEKGDEILKLLAQVLKNSFRKNDIIGRWGGEEFIVVLPKTDYDIALKLAERLRNRIENKDFNGIKVTVSIGVSEFQNKKEFEKALERADEALYNAKNNGRNQVKGKK